MVIGRRGEIAQTSRPPPISTELGTAPPPLKLQAQLGTAPPPITTEPISLTLKSQAQLGIAPPPSARCSAAPGLQDPWCSMAGVEMDAGAVGAVGADPPRLLDALYPDGAPSTAPAAAAAAESPAAPGSPAQTVATAAASDDWTADLAKACDEKDDFKDTMRAAIGEMCRRVGGPVHYLRARFPTVDSKNEFAAWLYHEFPLDEVSHYTLTGRRGLFGRWASHVTCTSPTEFTRMTN